ncbi:hypothetical protein KBC85_00805 [Candidatus Saccharibacteria bacterium]|nr:hypothetical protein [Candidatus Saccharibacteria bacterium]MDQ5958853.1 hypothetical protein [Patescibacteria group bacterium]
MNTLSKNYSMFNPMRFVEIAVNTFNNYRNINDQTNAIGDAKKAINNLLIANPIDEANQDFDIDTRTTQAQLATESAKTVELIEDPSIDYEQYADATILSILRSTVIISTERLPILLAKIFSKAAADELKDNNLYLSDILLKIAESILNDYKSTSTTKDDNYARALIKAAIEFINTSKMPSKAISSYASEIAQKETGGIKANIYRPGASIIFNIPR